MSSTRTQPNPRVASAISEQRDTTLAKIAGVIEERFEELGRALERELESELGERIASEVESASGSARERARREAAAEFNQAVRRLHGCASDEEWQAAVMDASAGFCTHAVLAAANGESLRVVRVRGLTAATLETPLASAPAVAASLESGGAVVARVSAAQISAPLAELLGAAEAPECAVVPVRADGPNHMVLIGAGEKLEVNGLEAMASLAGLALERRSRRPAALPPAATPEQDLPPEEEALRLRAQRFARVRASEIRLYKANAVRDGRANGKIYRELKEEIDAARVAYARQFLHASSTMPDYLHREFLRTLANDEIAALGEDYPGPLV
ncbi:MAG TPA: hypothetical protein VHA11_01980 [Bryobacteraceae bacterium]|nr:hypothetical protein [Bryobacteraceae bacterium]